MSAVVVLTPIITPAILAAWPVVTAAAVSAAAALGLSVKQTVKETVSNQVNESEKVEIEVTNGETLQNIATEDEIVLTKGTVELRVKRDARGRCTVCATGKGHTKSELKALAEQFSQRMTQCFVYNRVMSELKTRGFNVVNEEKMQNDTLRIHVRRWEG